MLIYLQCFRGQRRSQKEITEPLSERAFVRNSTVPRHRVRVIFSCQAWLITVFPVRASGKDRIDLRNSRYQHKFSNCTQKCCARGNAGAVSLPKQSGGLF
jgi:hypothetical protein